ncbi:MAG: hypothetical protein EAZ55_04650 [Cytophagales bacterium]|nr:MAG: hypothetical protein EAZ55_04650 [Cytophagales bacterium]
MKHFITFLFGLLLFSSCMMQEKIYFKADYSGNMTYNIDMSALMEMTKSLAQMDSSNAQKDPSSDFKEMIASLQKPEVKETMEKIEGISNFAVNTTNGADINIAFEFANLAALNRMYTILRNSNAMQEGNMLEDATNIKTIEYFSLKGTSLVYANQFPNTKQEGKKEQEEVNMDEMGDAFKMETILTFEKSIKKVTAKGLETQLTDRELKITWKTEHLTGKSKTPVVKVVTQ